MIKLGLNILFAIFSSNGCTYVAPKTLINFIFTEYFFKIVIKMTQTKFF